MKLRLCCAGLLAILAVTPALAQVETREGIDLQNQIAELRQELQNMQQAQQNGGGAPSNMAQEPSPQYQPPYQGPPGAGGGGDGTAELLVRVSALEEQNRQLQGKVDDLTNQMQRQNDVLMKQIGDLAFKMGQGPGGAPAAGPPGGDQGFGGGSQGPDFAQPAAPPVPTLRAPAQPAPPPVVRRTPEMALREGNAALARRDYVAAAAAAREAMANGHGGSQVNAQFLLARAEGGQRQYKEAAADFYQAYNRAPKSSTAPVALLGVANTLIAMNDSKDACQALAKISAEFPTAAGSVKAGVASARKRAACGR